MYGKTKQMKQRVPGKKASVAEGPTMFDDINNLFYKRAPVREPEAYDKNIFQINKVLSMDDLLLPIVAETSKALFTLRGRYYHLMYDLIPKTRNRPYIKYAKRSKLDEKALEKVKAVQSVTNYSGKEAYIAIQILEKEGVDVSRALGMNDEKRARRKR